MPSYLVATYRITNSEGYKSYVQAVLPTLMAHGAEVLVADYNSVVLDGDAPQVTIVIRFSSKEAARAWYDSPEYQAVIHHRVDNTDGCMVLTDQWTPPA